MSSEWPTVTLQEITSVLGDGLHGTPNYDDDGEYYFINGNNLSNGRILITDKTKRSPASEYEKHKKNLNDRTILVSINGTLGNIALYKGERVFLGKSACYFNVKPGVDKLYIRYVLENRDFQDYIQNLATGSTIKNVSLKLMREFSFKLPPLDLQKRISKILGELDAKTQLNHQINQTLEQMAQAIFKSWFVDFDPVKAKIAALEAGGSEEDALLAAMQAISGTSLCNADASAAGAQAELTRLQAEQPEQYAELRATAERFPSAMQDSELGKIPKGWRPVQVEHFIELSYGKALKKTVRIDGPYPVYGSGGITGSHNEPLVFGPGIIVGRKGTVGSIYWESKDFYPIDTAYYVSPKNGGSLSFSYYLLQTLGLKEMNTDAAVPGLNRNNVYRLEIPFYPVPIIERFTQIVDSISRKISASNAESELLTEFRDSLLPKLLFGELSITDAECQLAEAEEVENV